ncbi:hypothetical protein [Wolbachia endosymbiont of Pentidionis agamae]|uniref:hypothetical protein n=1 Tax=Wolbachia endosymbiont of Pentidionis agamae TaxID=3110435 RepID=UPI002FD117F2
MNAANLIDLEDGNDFSVGFANKRNVFVIKNGVKFMIGGNEDDVFIFVGNRTKGRFIGGPGNNVLNIEHYARAL